MGRMAPIKMGFVTELVDFDPPNLRPVARRSREVVPAEITPERKAVVEARVQAILDAHANNLIESLDVGADWLEATLKLARLPISNEEFTVRAKSIA